MRATRTPWFCRSLVVLSLGVAVGVWLGAAAVVARAKDPSIVTDSGASLAATEAAVVAGGEVHLFPVVLVFRCGSVGDEIRVVVSGGFDAVVESGISGRLTGPGARPGVEGDRL